MMFECQKPMSRRSRLREWSLLLGVSETLLEVRQAPAVFAVGEVAVGVGLGAVGGAANGHREGCSAKMGMHVR